MDESLRSRYARGRSRTRVERKRAIKMAGNGSVADVASESPVITVRPAFHTIPHHPTRVHMRGLRLSSATIGADGNSPAAGQLEEASSQGVKTSR
jgi:hypothetical protein